LAVMNGNDEAAHKEPLYTSGEAVSWICRQVLLLLQGLWCQEELFFISSSLLIILDQQERYLPLIVLKGKVPHVYVCVCIYTGCNRRNVPYFGRVFLMLNYTEKTQNTYIQSWMVPEIMAREVWNFDSC
jgi:hypothetical protein